MSVFTGFEPFAFHREGVLVGFDIDVLRSFAAGAGLEPAFAVRERFEDIWLEPAAGRSDTAAAGIARLPGRASPELAWSEPYFEVSRSILVHEERAVDLAHIDRFADRTIAFVRGSTADVDTRQRAPAGTRLRPIESQPEGMRLLISGEIDGLAMGAPSNEYNVRLHPGFALVDRHELAEPEGLRFPLASHSRDLLEALDRFINRARSDGELAHHVTRWMSG